MSLGFPMNNFFQKTVKYLRKENRLLSATLGVLLLFSLGTYALASFYPGETNDPNCAPGDSGCYVDVLPSQSGHSGHVLTTNGTTATWSSVAGSGTVTDITIGDLSPLFTSSVATSTSTPAVTFSLSNAGSYTILGNNTGSSAAPAYFTPTLASALFANQGTTTQVLHGNASGSPTWGAINLATDVTGTLPATNGGTGLSAYGSGYQILGMNGSGALEYKTVGGDLTLSGSSFTIVNDAITTAKIINNAVTYAKMQAVSTTSKLLGSSSTTTAVQEITLGSGLSLSGTTLSSTGVTTVGAINAQTKSANGLVIDSGSIFAQTADVSNVGIVSIIDQTFNGKKTFDDGLDAGDDLITSVASPVSGTDAANKAYVDGLVSGLNWKVSVNAATTTDLPLSPIYDPGASGVGAFLEGGSNGALGAIDGVTLGVNDRLLVKDETGGNEPYNGVYIVTAVGDGSNKYKLTRCTACDEASEFSNAAVAVLEGTANAGTAWTQTNTITTVGSDNVAWVQFLSNAYSEGTGIDITSGVISVDFSTVTGTLGLTKGGTGLSSAGSGYQILGMNGSGALEYKTVGGDLTLSGSSFTIANDAVTTAKIINNAVTYAKMQAVSTTSKLLGSSSTTTPVQEITIGSGLSLSGTTLTATGTGTVTSFSAGDLSPLFTTSEADATSTPALSFTLSNAGSYTILGNNTGSSAAPAYFTPTLASALFANQGTTTQVLHGNASGSPTWGAISLSADVSGTLPLANGGTGQTSKIPAFDALSPMSASGDIIYGGASGTGTRLPKGTDGQCLLLSSGLPAWSTCAAGGSGVSGLAAIGSTGSPNANGATISGTNLILQPANGTYGGVVTITNQTFAGVKTFSSNVQIGTGLDIIVAGYGAGTATTNTVFGVAAGQSQSSSSATYNTWLGYQAGYNATTADYNVAVGTNAGLGITTGGYNTAIGIQTMNSGVMTGSENTVVGAAATNLLSSGSYNVVLGAGVNGLTTGSRNILIGVNDGGGTNSYGGDIIATGSGNVFIGAWNGGGSVTSSTSNVIALSDGGTGSGGSGALRMFINSTGTNFGGSTSPTSLFNVGASNQFQINTTGAIVAATGITSSGTMTFSGLVSCAGLQTNGSGVVSCTSDQNLKDIQSDFTAGLDAVMQINPKTYTWKEGTYLYDGGVRYSGFIAQNVQSAFPEGVSVGAEGQLQLSTTAVLAATVNAIKDLNLKFTPLTSIDVNQNNSLASLVAQFLHDAVVYIKELTVGTLRIDDRVCVDEVCISKEQFKQILINGGGVAPTSFTPPENSGSGGGGSSSGDSSAVDTGSEDVSSEPVAEGVIPSNEEEVVVIDESEVNNEENDVPIENPVIPEVPDSEIATPPVEETPVVE